MLIMGTVNPSLSASALTAWRFQRVIQVPATEFAYAEIALDGQVHERAAASLEDLRIIADKGEEVPYVVRRWAGEDTEVAVPARIVNRSMLLGRLSRLELDAGANRRTHNRIRFGIEESNFTRQVTIEGSDNRRTWLLLGSGTIYRFVEEKTVDRTELGYPDSLYRYLRVTVHHEGKPELTVRSAALLFRRVVPPREDRWFSGPVQTTVDTRAKTSILVIDAGFHRLPISRIAAEFIAPRAFARDAEIEVSDDGQVWFPLTTVALTRGPGSPGPPVELRFGESRGRFIRVTVRNGDNEPVQVSRVEVYGVRRTLLFPIASGRSYTLFLGNSAAPMPQYDLPRVLSLADSPPRVAAARLGLMEANPAYVAVRRPWTEEHPLVLWAALGATILVLLVLIIRTAKGTGTAA